MNIKLCLPAFVYLILSVVISSLEFLTDLNLLRLILELLLTGLITYFLNWVCEKAKEENVYKRYDLPQNKNIYIH